jgi:16S rRNA processing protein RimM
VEAAYLVVARFRKPHGLKGEALVISMTDEPEDVFVPGRLLVPVTDQGVPIGESVTISRARPFHRGWLLAFEGVDDRSVLDQWSGWHFGVRVEELRPLDEREMYVHEVPGAKVVERGVEIGVAKEIVEGPGGSLLVIEREGREHLIPFRAPIVVKLERESRTIEVALPPGLLEI